MAAAYFFTSPIDVEVKLEGEELRKKVDMKMEKEKAVSCPVYYDGESVAGQVCPHLYCNCGVDNPWDLPQVVVRIRDGKKITHEGVKVEFVGSIGASVPSLVLMDLSHPHPQNSSTTGVTITNFCPSPKRLPHQGRCGRHRRSTSCSRT